MAKKHVSFNYDWHKAEVVFEVDLEKFTPELALMTLKFFSWDYDDEADPVYEVLKKYALEVLIYLSERGFHSVDSVRKEFNPEGFGKIDGSIGILLLDYEEFNFDAEDLEMEVTDV